MKKILSLLLVLLCGSFLRAETQVHYAGTGGWSTRNALDAFCNSVADYHPDTVIPGGGTNDSVNPEQMMSTAQFEKNYRELIQQIKSSGVKKTAILTVAPIIESYLRGRFPNHPEKGDLNQKITKYNDVIRKLANEEKSTLVDMHALVMRNGKLESRKDIPVWGKELNEWFQGSPENALKSNATKWIFSAGSVRATPFQKSLTREGISDVK